MMSCLSPGGEEELQEATGSEERKSEDQDAFEMQARKRNSGHAMQTAKQLRAYVRMYGGWWFVSVSRRVGGHPLLQCRERLAALKIGDEG